MKWNTLRLNKVRMSLIAALLLALLAGVGGVLMTETADADTCQGPFTTDRWGKGPNCAAAQADLDAQASAVCDVCPWDGACGSSPPTIISQSSCYYAGGQWIIDGTIEASCVLAAPRTCR